MFSLSQLFAVGLTYLAILFGSAYAAEKGLIPGFIVQHPAIRVLSLGVFAGTIALFASVGFAAEYGSSFLLYFLGASAVFLVSPVLLTPITRVAFAHKLGSLADVFAFRYPAPWVGGIISLLMLLGVLPLLALQIHAVSVTVHLLNQDLSEPILAAVFCTTMSIFAILFGARHLSTRDKHQGLVFAIALESIVKITAFIILAWYATSQVFGGMEGLFNWLESHRQTLSATDHHLSDGASRSLLLTFFAATIAMPHVFHMLVTENDDSRVLKGARWGFPLYLLLISLTVPPVLWASTKLNLSASAEFFPVSLGLSLSHSLGNDWFSILAFVAGLSAASGVLIVTSLALASMILNHVLLPLYRPRTGTDVYSLLMSTRRILIALIFLASFGIFRLFGEQQSLMSIGIVSFVAVMQFLPALIGGFHWRQANQSGLIAGLIAGFTIWFSSLLLPLIDDLLFGGSYTLQISERSWHVAAMLSVSANGIFFMLFSLVSKSSSEELSAASKCMDSSTTSSIRPLLQARTVTEMENNLATALGRRTSSREMSLALHELSFPEDESRPHALNLLRNQMETNLASMLGQTVAHRIIHRVLPLKEEIDSVLSLESYLEEYRSQLTGLVAELDDLRRYHRSILDNLPTAVCSIDSDNIVRIWNQEMQAITGIDSSIIVGQPANSIREPWKDVLNTFLYNEATHRPKVEVNENGSHLLLNLHKASIAIEPSVEGDLVIVVEDITASQLIEDQVIHNERLASIGQLVAGIAHEIGNPVTAIACLAQNLKLESDMPETFDTSDQILQQTERVSTILQSLINFAHTNRTGNRDISVPVNLRLCIDEAIKLLSYRQQSISVSFNNQCSNDIATLGDPQRLSQVFVNLLSNAQDASKENDEVTISGRLEGHSVLLDITDQGHGIPATDLKKVFEPFFTTKTPGKGTGLGLAIVNTIIEEHHGSIDATLATESSGTRVTIRLPAYNNTDL